MESQVEELKRTLAQVHLDSREIEAELEAELQARDEACERLKTQLSAAQAESQKWRAQVEALQERTNLLEAQNDEFEQASRIHNASVTRLQQENQRLLERLALADLDASQTQASSEELQRTKDSLTDAEEEISKLHRQIESLRTRRPEHKAGRRSESRSQLPLDLYQPTELRSREWSLSDGTAPRPNGKAPLIRNQASTAGHGTTLSGHESVDTNI